MPQFTQCFQQTLPIWVPSAILWLLAPRQVYIIKFKSLNTLNQSKISWNIYNITRLVLVTLVILANSVRFVLDLTINDNDNRPSPSLARLTSSLINVVTFVLFGCLLALHRIIGYHTSGLAWIFTSLSMLATGPTLYMYIKFDHLDNDNLFLNPKLELLLFAIHSISIMVLFLMTCWADKRSSMMVMMKNVESSKNGIIFSNINNYNNNINDLDHHCTNQLIVAENTSYIKSTSKHVDLTLVNSNLIDQQQQLSLSSNQSVPQCSFLSFITFSWLTPLIVKGYRRPLCLKDLWLLNSEDSTQVVASKFDRYWAGQWKKKSEEEEEPKKQRTVINNEQESLVKQKYGTFESTEQNYFYSSSSSSTPGVVWTIVRTFQIELCFCALAEFCISSLHFINPQLLK